MKLYDIETENFGEDGPDLYARSTWSWWVGKSSRQSIDFKRWMLYSHYSWLRLSIWSWSTDK